MMRLAVLCDLAEEGWHSMDLVADRLLEQARERHGASVQAFRVRPTMRRRCTRLPVVGGFRLAFNGDRLLNRFFDYPRAARRLAKEADAFHLADHSYAQLALSLPPGRVGVYCHDLDAFRCLLEPLAEPRSGPFRAMARRILAAFRTAAVVFHSTQAVREQLLRFELTDPGRLVHAPLGVDPVFQPASPRDDAPAPRARPYLLHVGSCVRRKRIDVLLEVFAAARREAPDLELVQAGGTWTTDQRRSIDRLGLGSAVFQYRQTARTALARLYRGASVVVLTSEAEGFGLPVIEALASGSMVVASDLPALREAGGTAAVFCPVGDVPSWARAIVRLLRDPLAAPPLSERLRHAAGFTWERYASAIIGAYERLVR